MKTFIKLFFVILIADFVIGLLISVVSFPSYLTFLSIILDYTISFPLRFISPMYPYYAPGSLPYSIMIIGINTLLQTTAVYVLWRVFKLSRR